MEQRIVKLDPASAPANSYRMTRPINFEGVLFSEGDLVEFNDEALRKLFIRNNYIK